MSDVRVELVAAVAANGVIGRGGQLPWRLPDDLNRFKALTQNHTVIMGRKTYESIGRPLPNRRNIIVSSTLTSAPPNTELAHSLEQALTFCTGTVSRAFIIGGAQLYVVAFAQAHILHLTELDDAVEGDTCFPPFDRSQWRLIEDIFHPRDVAHSIAFHFRTYERLPIIPPSPPSPIS